MLLRALRLAFYRKLGASIQWVLEYIVLKVSFFGRSIREDHPSNSVLDASDPLTLVHAAISPEHLSITMSLVIEVVTFVYVSTRPCVDSMATLLIMFVVTIVIIERHPIL